MIEQIEIHLKYEGPDVENGTMALQDVIPVLQGFSGAYTSLADTENPDVTHRIKLSGVRQGSADIVLEVIYQFLTEHSQQIGAAAGLVGIVSVTAFPVVKKIFDVIGIKKHVGNGDYTERLSIDNGIEVTNSQNVQIIVQRESYEAFKGGKLDRDLERLTRPLKEGHIDLVEFEAEADSGEAIVERVTVEDRPNFEITDLAVTTTTETELVAKLNSLTKSTNSGYLYLQKDKRIFYRYVSDDATKLYAIFGNYHGSIKIRCTAKMDDQLEVVSVDILQIDRMQNDMFDER